MKKLLLIVSAVFLTATIAEAGRCSGGANCTACTNCNYCKNCSQNGGTCSVCKPEKKSESKKKPVKKKK